MTTPRLLSERYQLGDTLGYGGMSEVHGGRDVRLSRDVAVKVLRADLARDPQFQIRFRKEAQNAAALNHPAIVAVYDTGETNTEYGPLPYIVMEYVDGRTLRDIVKTEGPLSERRAMETMADTCAALDFSHRNGIIHRDVKPANVMITTAGAVKVMDFGIARALADGQGVTQTAAVIGTAQYLSPEQARGEAVDARSDVYAAGCVLYELVTGEPPFTGDSPVAVAYQHVREDAPPPSRANPNVSPALDAVVLKAMSKNPANRYQSAGEMRSDLVRVLGGQHPMAPMVMTDEDRTSMLGAAGPTEAIPGRHRPVRPDRDDEDDEPRRSRKGIIALAALVFAAVAAVLLLIYTGAFSSGPTQVAVPDVVGQPLQQAEQELNRAGFQTEDQRMPSSPEQMDQVLSTDPAAGIEADEGTIVRLQVGAGPEMVAVPPLERLTVDEAAAALEEAGLQLAAGAPMTEVVTDPAQIDRVLSSDPVGGTQVRLDTPIRVVVGVAPETVTVPDVTGSNVDQARGNLEGADLAVQVTEVDSAEEQGTVLNQDPAGGSEVDVGSTVTLTVSRGNQIEMPDLIGLTAGQAQQQLRQAGHTGQIQFTQGPAQNSSEIGRVVAQDVPPGTGFTADQTVTLTLGVRGGNQSTTPTDDDGIPGFPGFPG